MNQITIGERGLATITGEEILQIAMIEGCCAHLSYWGIPEITDFDNTMFSDIVVIDYQSKKISDGTESRKITFFLHHKNFTFHYHRDGDINRSERQRFSIKTIKYLLKQQFYLPIL